MMPLQNRWKIKLNRFMVTCWFKNTISLWSMPNFQIAARCRDPPDHGNISVCLKHWILLGKAYANRRYPWLTLAEHCDVRDGGVCSIPLGRLIFSENRNRLVLTFVEKCMHIESWKISKHVLYIENHIGCPKERFIVSLVTIAWNMAVIPRNKVMGM